MESRHTCPWLDIIIGIQMSRNLFSSGWIGPLPKSFLFTSWAQKTTLSNSCLAGYLRYNSTNNPARVLFCIKPNGELRPYFRFTAAINGIERSFPYHVVYDPINPSGGAASITSATATFPSTSSKVTVTSPIHNETEGQYVIYGEIRIYVDPELTMSAIPSSIYSSDIYCFLTSY